MMCLTWPGWGGKVGERGSRLAASIPKARGTVLHEVRAVVFGLQS